MRGGWLGSRILWVLSVGLGVSCSQIIGIDEYEIVDDREPPRPGEGGTSSDAGGAPSQAGSEPSAAGEATVGGNAGTGAVGQAGEAPQAGGAGGAAPEGCQDSDCDDTIDCTVDSCDENGECVHTPDSSVCDSDEGECIVCKVGLGCVPGELNPRELLVDPWFDESSTAWTEDVRFTTLQSTIITFDDYADSGDFSAWFLGVEDVTTAAKQAYFDLYQTVTIPTNTRALTLTGQYEMLLGAHDPAADYMIAGLFDGTDPLLEFHTWEGVDAEAVPWVGFEYAASEGELEALKGIEATFDIYGYSWDTGYYFDTLSLEATVCE